MILPYILTVILCISLFGIINQYDPTVDLRLNVGHFDLYFSDLRQFDV